MRAVFLLHGIIRSTVVQRPATPILSFLILAMETIGLFIGIPRLFKDQRPKEAGQQIWFAFWAGSPSELWGVGSVNDVVETYALAFRGFVGVESSQYRVKGYARFQNVTGARGNPRSRLDSRIIIDRFGQVLPYIGLTPIWPGPFWADPEEIGASFFQIAQIRADVAGWRSVYVYFQSVRAIPELSRVGNDYVRIRYVRQDV